MSGWARRSSWALSLGQRLAMEGGSIVVRLPPRFLLRLESPEERGHLAEAICDGYPSAARDLAGIAQLLAEDTAICGEAASNSFQL